jgi:hypothetical protein
VTQGAELGRYEGRLQMFRFEKLDVWQKAMDWVSPVYSATSDFPSDERFGLVSQLRCSRVSITANIAEGSGRSRD